MLVQRVFMDLKNHRAIESLRNGRSGDDRNLDSLAILASAATRPRNSGMGMSPTVRNKPL
jgi:hypothetical protein